MKLKIKILGYRFLCSLLYKLNYKKIVYFNGGIGDEIMVMEVLNQSSLPIIFLSNYKSFIYPLLKNSRIKIFSRKFKFFHEFIILGENLCTKIQFINLSYEDVIKSSKNLLSIRDLIANKCNIDYKQNIKKFKVGTSKKIGLQITGVNARNFIRTKEWGIDNFQNLVNDCLLLGFSFVQFMSEGDPFLYNVEKKEGLSTIPLMSEIKKCDFVICQVGMLMHLCYQAEVPSLVIYGGRENPKISGYQQNKNLFSHIECSFCWKNECENDLKCMKLLTVDLIIENIKNMYE